MDPGLCTAVLLIHTLSEALLGGRKLKGWYAFEKDIARRDLEKRGDGSVARKQRVKLMQYTRYHAASRLSLALLGALPLVKSWNASDSENLQGSVAASDEILLPLAFWHVLATAIQVWGISMDGATPTPTFWLHFALAAAFVYWIYVAGSITAL